MDRQSSNAELEARRDLCQRGVSALTSGQAVGDDADMVAALGLSIGEIQNVTNDPTDRRAYGVQDAKGPV